MNAAVSSPAFHAVPCGEETRSAKPRRSSSRHRSSDAGSTFPVSSASSSMKRERPARCNAKTWAICCEVNTDFPFITDKDGACFTQGKNDMSFSVPWQQAFRTPDERNGNEMRQRHSRGVRHARREKLSFLHCTIRSCASPPLFDYTFADTYRTRRASPEHLLPLYMFPLRQSGGTAKGT